MKIELRSESDVQIIRVSGPVTADKFAILKTALTKLFKVGKNKIVLELAGSKELSSDILRELALLNLLASELSGRIVLAEVDDATRAKIQTFSKPPVVNCYVKTSDAVTSFKAPPPKAEPAPAPRAAPPPPVAAAPAPTPTPAPAAPAALAAPVGPDPGTPEFLAVKQQFRQREITELGPLRKQIESLAAENTSIKEQLLSMVMVRRSPPDGAAADAKIKALEQQLEDFLLKEKEQKEKAAAAK